MNQLTNNYISTVCGMLNQHSQVNEKLKLELIAFCLNTIDNVETLNEQANVILNTYPHLDCRTTSRKRYKFTQSLPSRSRVLKVVFDKSFEADPDKSIVAAELMDPTHQSFYSPYKKACYIKAPRLIADFCNSTLVKIIVSVATTIFFYRSCYRTYQAIKQLIPARVIPLVINHTSLSVIRAFNAIWAQKERLLKQYGRQIYRVMLIASVAVWILPNIPYVTTVVRRVSSFVDSLKRSSLTIGNFIWDKAWAVPSFTWKSCSDFSEFIYLVTEPIETERLQICKQKAYDVWDRVVNKTVVQVV